jgi:hypothetical protein
MAERARALGAVRGLTEAESAVLGLLQRRLVRTPARRAS